MTHYRGCLTMSSACSDRQRARCVQVAKLIALRLFDIERRVDLNSVNKRVNALGIDRAETIEVRTHAELEVKVNPLIEQQRRERLPA